MRTSNMIADLVLERLGVGDASHLILIVSVRKALNSTPFKGDLSDAIAYALRRLVGAGTVPHRGYLFSLCHRRCGHTGLKSWQKSPFRATNSLPFGT
jgi:hypothetical protein